MRVLHIPPYAPPIEGGSERYCFNLSKLLIERGHEAKVFTSRKTREKTRIIEGVPCYFFRNYWHMLKLNPFSIIYHALPSGVDWADVVHVHSYIYFIGSQVALYRRRRKFPLIIHLHGGTSPISTKVYGVPAAMIKILYDATVGRWGMRTADVIMSSSKADMQNAINIFNIDPERIVYIPNSVFVKEFYSDPQNPPIVTFLARLTHLKGCHWIPQIIKYVNRYRKDVRFWIVGEGYMDSYLRTKLEGLPVTFWGAVPHKIVARIFAESYVSYLPSYTESCPLALIESLASYVPVVATRVGGIPEIIHDGETGFLTQLGDHKQMAEKILWLLDNEKEKIKMGVAGRKFVEENHSWRSTVTKIEKVYRAII